MRLEKVFFDQPLICLQTVHSDEMKGDLAIECSPSVGTALIRRLGSST